MRDLATRLGASLTFPTKCWYCGSAIFLYAHPNGGFAIFDSLGIPWPKHACYGRTASGHNRFNIRVSIMGRNDISVIGSTLCHLAPGLSMTTLVLVSQQIRHELFKVRLFDGASEFIAYHDSKISSGLCVTFSTRLRQGLVWISGVTVHTVPNQTVASSRVAPTRIPVWNTKKIKEAQRRSEYLLRNYPEHKMNIAPSRLMIERQQFVCAATTLWFIMHKSYRQMGLGQLVSTVELVLVLLNIANFFDIIPSLLMSAKPIYTGNLLAAINTSLLPVIKCGEVNGHGLTPGEVVDRLDARIKRELRTRNAQHATLISEAVAHMKSVLTPQ
jgi:hypothetical protein